MDRGYTVAELWAAARRRAMAALVVFAAVLGIGVVVVAALPNEYRAEATIVLEPHRPHPELITLADTTLLEDRLRMARQQLLARPLLSQIVQEFDLYPDVRKASGDGAAVALLRKDIEVRPDGESAVVVAYRTRIKEKAAPVVASLAHGFALANAEVRTGHARRVLDVLEEELAQVGAKLEEQETQIREYRLAHDGELPEQVESNIREADSANRLLETLNYHIRDLERRRAELVPISDDPEVRRLAAIEADLIRALNHAHAVFDEGHPEPTRLQRELDGLVELKAQAEARVARQRRERDTIGRDIAAARAEAKVLSERIEQARARAAAGARRAAEMAVMERDRTLSREKYRSLMSRRVESEVALWLEERTGTDATRIVDPPAEPSGPSAPDRPRLLLVVLALAAGLGVGVGMFLESRDTTLRTPAQARARLGVPLLGTLPSVRGRRGK